ncbi:MAG: TIM barrel protein, partial [Chloroflexi bacterium]|nr:TIM barrel protein [Chloroflexota bacterium]
QDVPPDRRLERAAALGFEELEILAERAEPVLCRELSRLGLRISLLVTPGMIGDYRGGERGYITSPGGGERFLAAVRPSLELADRLGARRLAVLAGPRAAGSDGATEERRLVEALSRAGELAGRAGVTLCLEPLNAPEHPGHSLTELAVALRVLKKVDHPYARLLFDVYHLGLGADPVAAARRAAPYLAHVQLADVPGRHEPGTGQVDFSSLLDTLDACAPDASVAFEYRPLASTEEGLRRLPSWLVQRLGVQPASSRRGGP